MAGIPAEWASVISRVHTQVTVHKGEEGYIVLKDGELGDNTQVTGMDETMVQAVVTGWSSGPVSYAGGRARYPSFSLLSDELGPAQLMPLCQGLSFMP